MTIINNTMYSAQTQNLELPPPSAEMLWGYLLYPVVAGGTYNTNLKNTVSRNISPLPQSIIVDTSKMTAGSITIIWDEGDLNYEIDCPAGVKHTFTVPAISDCTYSVNFSATAAGGDVRIDLTNFPQIPQNYIISGVGSGSNVTVVNTSADPVPVTDGTLAALVSATGNTQTTSGATVYATPFVSGAPVTSGSPLPVVDNSLSSLVSATQTTSGLTTHSTAFAQPATLVSGSVTTSGAATIGTPPANSNLRKLVLTIAEQATQATAGNNPFFIYLNSVLIFQDSVFIPATVLSTDGMLYKMVLDFDTVAFNAGATGTLTANWGSALTGGSLRVNAYFD